MVLVADRDGLSERIVRNRLPTPRLDDALERAGPVAIVQRARATARVDEIEKVQVRNRQIRLALTQRAQIVEYAHQRIRRTRKNEMIEITVRALNDDARELRAHVRVERALDIAVGNANIERGITADAHWQKTRSDKELFRYVAAETADDLPTVRLPLQRGTLALAVCAG